MLILETVTSYLYTPILSGAPLSHLNSRWADQPTGQPVNEPRPLDWSAHLELRWPKGVPLRMGTKNPDTPGKEPQISAQGQQVMASWPPSSMNRYAPTAVVKGIECCHLASEGRPEVLASQPPSSLTMSFVTGLSGTCQACPSSCPHGGCHKAQTVPHRPPPPKRRGASRLVSLR